MDPIYVITGYVISILGGFVLLKNLIDKLAWDHLEKKGIPRKTPATLTSPMGMVERFLFTTAFLMQQPAFVAIWLTFKVAAQHKDWKRETYTVFLIGSGLSIAVSFLGAWISVGMKLSPLLPK